MSLSSHAAREKITLAAPDELDGRPEGHVAKDAQRLAVEQR